LISISLVISIRLGISRINSFFSGLNPRFFIITLSISYLVIKDILLAGFKSTLSGGIAMSGLSLTLATTYIELYSNYINHIGSHLLI
jgi:hypothetical protein